MNIKINKNIAQGIVDAVKEVVDKDINFIDKNGIIIASTNEQRVNSYHQAGYEAIEKSNNIVVENDDIYKGSQKGINYPIKMNNATVGAIGITGVPEDISKLGFLVTKITEIFIKEQQLNYRYQWDKQRVNYVVKSLIYNNIEDKNQIEEILRDFDIDPNQKFAIVIMKINKEYCTSGLEAIENDITRVFDLIGNKFKVYVYPNEFIVLINEERYKMLKQVYLDILEKYKNALSGGVGRLNSLYDTHKSYKEARIALKYSQENNKILTYINSLKLEVILENLDNETKNIYVEKVLRKLSEDEINLLETYYKNDMSLKLTSQDLYIHKNTLQYKLEKIKQKSQLDPRIFKESVILYLATIMKNK